MPTTVTLPITADAWIDTNDATVQGGTDQVLQVHRNTRYLVYLLADLSSIPTTAQVQSAYLNIWDLGLHPGWPDDAMAPLCWPCKAAWGETTVKAGNQPAEDRGNFCVFLAPQGPGFQPIESAQAAGWLAADITKLVDGWVRNPAANFGLALDDIVSGSNVVHDLASRENPTVGHRPTITVTYTDTGSAVMSPAWGSSAALLSGAQREPQCYFHRTPPPSGMSQAVWEGHVVTDLRAAGFSDGFGPEKFGLENVALWVNLITTWLAAGGRWVQGASSDQLLSLVSANSITVTPAQAFAYGVNLANAYFPYIGASGFFGVDGENNAEWVYPSIDRGTSTGGNTSTTLNTGHAWALNEWIGYEAVILKGTGAGQARSIVANTTGGQLTVFAWGVTPDNTSVWYLRNPKFNPAGVGPNFIAFAQGVASVHPGMRCFYRGLGQGTAYQYLKEMLATNPTFFTYFWAVGNGQQNQPSRWNSLYTEAFETGIRVRNLDYVRNTLEGAATHVLAVNEECLSQVFDPIANSEVSQAKTNICTWAARMAEGFDGLHYYKLNDQSGEKYRISTDDYSRLFLGYYAFQRFNQYCSPRTWLPMRLPVDCSNTGIVRYTYRNSDGTGMLVGYRNPIQPTNTLDAGLSGVSLTCPGFGLVPKRSIDLITGTVNNSPAYSVSSGVVTVTGLVAQDYPLFVEFGPAPGGGPLTRTTATFQIRAKPLTQDGNPPNPATSFTWDVENDQFSPEFPAFHSTGSGWSAWQQMTQAALALAVAAFPNSQSTGFPLELVLAVTPNGASRMEILAEVVFDATPTVTWQLGTAAAPVPLGREYDSGNLAFSSLGFYVYLDGSGAPVAQRNRDWNAANLWGPAGASVIPAGKRPTRLILIDSVNRRGDEIDYVGEAGAALLSFGYTCGEFPASAQYRAALVAAGMPHVRAGVAIPLNGYVDYGVANVSAALAAWATAHFGPYLTAGYAGADVVSIGIQDEPNVYLPVSLNALLADSAAVARFQAYLRGDYQTSFGPPAGLFAPADFGQSTWGAVLPVGRSTVRVGNESVSACRLFYWSMRFIAWDMSRYSAAATAAVGTTLGLSGTAPTATNWNNYQGRFFSPSAGGNNPDPSSLDSCSISHDWWEFARLGGGGTLYSEDWYQDGVAFFASYYANRLRCAAQVGGRRFGCYQIPLRANPRTYGPLQKFSAAISHGATEIFHYKIGPQPLEPQVGYAPVDPLAISRIAACHAFIAPTEPYLLNATLQGCGVAILAPRTGYAWDERTQAPNSGNPVGDNSWGPHLQSMDYIVDEWGVWKALADQGIPCDFVDEDQLSAGGLAPYRVLYVTEQHLPLQGTAAHAALVAWMQGGGTLSLGPNAGSRDEEDQPNTIIETATGIVATARVPSPSHFDADASNGTVTGPGGTVTVYGPKAALSAQGGAAVYATRSDAAPAILVKNVGAGRVVYFTFNAGMSYWRSHAATSDGQAPGFSVDLLRGFSPLLRAWIGYPCTLAGVTPPATGSVPEVELLTWRRSDSVIVFCHNWSQAGQAPSLPGFQVTLTPGFVPLAVGLALGGSVVVSHVGGVYTLSFTLGATDALLLPGPGWTGDLPAAGDPIADLRQRLHRSAWIERFG
jgi:hypothetical protein